MTKTNAMTKTNRKSNVERLQVLQSFGSKESKHATNQVVQLYERGVIKTVNQAGTMINKIISGRGAAKIKTTEKIATLQKNNPKGYRPRINVKSAPAIQSYYVTGSVDVTKTYSKLKDGNKVEYDKKYNDTHRVALTVQATSTEDAIKQFTTEVNATWNTAKQNKDPFTDYDKNGNVVPSDADKEKFQSKGIETGERVVEDSLTYAVSTVRSMFVSSATPASSYSASSEMHSPMRSASHVIYDFIPSDDKLLKNDGFCVIDQIVGIYGRQFENEPIVNGRKILKLTREYVENCFHQIYRELQNLSVDIEIPNPVDIGIEDDDEEIWKLSDGITPTMLHKFLISLNISYYAFDITNKCFDKYISTSRNYNALVYFCVNNHMYWVSDKSAALSLTCQARDVETKIKSVVLDEVKLNNEYVKEIKEFKQVVNGVEVFKSEIIYKDIYENIDIQLLKDPKYKNSVIIYSKEQSDIKLNTESRRNEKKLNLNQELDDYIRIFKSVPKASSIKNQHYEVMSFVACGNIIISIDPNDTHSTNYKDIMKWCLKYNIQFRNQTYGALMKELRKLFFSKDSMRQKFSPGERLQIFDKFKGCCNTCKTKLLPKGFHIDHIKALANGGGNEIDNLQLLCKECHYAKSKEEQQDGYVKISDTESSFNSQSLEIIQSGLCESYAFVETLLEEIPSYLNAKIVRHLDINRCRKNQVYYSKYDYPLFTVMDQVQPYEPCDIHTSPGLYYVETTQYNPMRGNGWYTPQMIQYCLDVKLISHESIKFVIFASLSIKHDYFNKFIDFIYQDHEISKRGFNTIVGCFKPKIRENWRTLLINTDRNVAFNHYLKSGGCFIDVRNIGEIKYIDETEYIGDTTFYQVYQQSLTSREETEAPIYQMILEQEAIELHKLQMIVESKGGVVLDLITDCVSCVFQNDILPFEIMEDGLNVKEYFYDTDRKMPKYKLESAEHRLKVERLPKYLRSDTYTYSVPVWNCIPDVIDNDFMPLVNQILDNKISINIDGRAGTGKSTLVKMLQIEMGNRGMIFESTAPTNKACRIINGTTIHKFVKQFKLKSFKEKKVEYIIIDEISMVPELFYKFFIVLKRALPEIRFIIAGDFAQLLPINDRVGDCDYKESFALNELCGGNRLQLSKCRRSDDIVYNMCLPQNINKLKKNYFSHTFTDLHICLTNQKRIAINQIMIDKKEEEYLLSEEYLISNVKPLCFPKLHYDNNSQDVKLFPGMPIISKVNDASYEICNNETFKIKGILHNDELIIVTDDEYDITIPFDMFQKMFYPAYCITCHKSQGQTYDHPYTIHQFDHIYFDERLKYVALSRSTNVKYINIL